MELSRKITSKILVVVLVMSMSLPVFATPDTTKALRSGSKGDQVKYLQYNLAGFGYYKGAIDSSFGSGTLAAVKSYQSANGLSVDGVAGPNTLTSLVGKVKNLQDNLYGLGYYNSGIDSVFGPGTTTAVKNYQKASSLTVDGIAGPNTLSSIASKVKSIQTNLKTLGYYSSSIDGHYGPGTISAVKSFQSKKGLSATGIANSTTISKIKSSLNNDVTTYKVSIKSLYQSNDGSIIRYGNGKTTTVAKSECGGVSLAMALNALKNTSSFTGRSVMQWMANNGYYNGGGTIQSGLVSYARKQGLTAGYADTSSALIDTLKKGGVAIAIVKDKTGNAYFARPTSSGHYILVSGYRVKDGVKQVYINNPMTSKVSGWFDLTKLEKNVKNEKDGYSNSYVTIRK